jgi:aspartate aminotransferase
MITTAPILDRIQPSASYVVTQRARELRASGIDVVTISSGEPDFPTPPHVCDAAYEAMRRGETGYTAADGTPALKAAIIAKFKRENGLDFTPKEISVGSGAKQVIHAALLATLAPGDEVILPTPCWVSYRDIAALAEGVAVPVPCPQNNGFKLRPEDLEAAITPRTKFLLLCAPGNPAGAVYSRAELEALAAVVRLHAHVGVMTDDIYEHIIFDGLKFVTFAEAAPDLRDRTLTINGVSKAYSMTGWRIGYAAGPANVIRAMGKLQTQISGCPSSISQAAAVAALTGPQDFVAERASAFQHRRDTILAALEKIPGLSCTRPNGTFYLFVGCAGLLGRTTPTEKILETDGDVALYLLEYGRVAVVQGAAYGMSPFFRISIASSLDKLEEGCRRIAAACAALV